MWCHMLTHLETQTLWLPLWYLHKHHMLQVSSSSNALQLSCREGLLAHTAAYASQT